MKSIKEICERKRSMTSIWETNVRRSPFRLTVINFNKIRHKSSTKASILDESKSIGNKMFQYHRIISDAVLYKVINGERIIISQFRRR